MDYSCKGDVLGKFFEGNPNSPLPIHLDTQSCWESLLGLDYFSVSKGTGLFGLIGSLSDLQVSSIVASVNDIKGAGDYVLDLVAESFGPLWGGIVNLGVNLIGGFPNVPGTMTLAINRDNGATTYPLQGNPHGYSDTEVAFLFPWIATRLGVGACLVFPGMLGVNIPAAVVGLASVLLTQTIIFSEWFSGTSIRFSGIDSTSVGNFLSGNGITEILKDWVRSNVSSVAIASDLRRIGENSLSEQEALRRRGVIPPHKDLSNIYKRVANNMGSALPNNVPLDLKNALLQLGNRNNVKTLNQLGNRNNVKTLNQLGRNQIARQPSGRIV